MLYSSEWHASVAVCVTKTSHSVDVFPCPAHWLRRSCSGRVSSGHTLCHMHHSLHFQLCAWGGHTKGMLQWTTHSFYTAAHVRTYPILGDVLTSWALRGTYIRMYTRTYESCSLLLIEPFEWLYSPPTHMGWHGQTQSRIHLQSWTHLIRKRNMYCPFHGLCLSTCCVWTCPVMTRVCATDTAPGMYSF